MKNTLSQIAYTLILSLGLITTAAQAQTTAFTYQGKLTDASAPANGNYDMQFRLFDTQGAGTGTQQGSTITNSTIQVTNGIFSVNLDFGSAVFSGATLYLEISVRPAGSTGGYTSLAPRQQITSAPYAVKSLKAATADTATSATNATQLGGVAANQYVQTTDSRLTDSRNPLPGSGNYIQNTTAQQPSTNFNIGGNGTAGGTLSGNVVNAQTQYNIGGNRILSVSNSPGNIYVGTQAGLNNTINGYSNNFFGYSAGFKNTTGSENAFFGSAAGTNNTEGWWNSFFGVAAGTSNTKGSSNTFIGGYAGYFNTEGNLNTFVAAGYYNQTGNENSFFGFSAGDNNRTGNENSFFGRYAGSSNTTESYNTFIGAYSNGHAGITNATALGYKAKVAQSNSLVLGSINGVNNATADTKVGIGTTTPLSRLDVRGDLFIGLTSTPNAPFVNSLFVNNDGGDANNFFRLDGSGNNLYIVGSSGAGATTGAGIIFRTGTAGGGEVDRFGIYPDGTVALNVLGTAGGTQLCRNASLIISACSSSLRYKTNITPFNFGLNLVNQLQPITFKWKNGGMLDLGLGAEDVEKIEPLLVNYNDKGEVEGVKYDRIGVVLLNAVKEQQTQIKQQRKQIEQQQVVIDGLKKLVCQQNPQADVCKENY
jgi:hypothetical protein